MNQTSSLTRRDFARRTVSALGLALTGFDLRTRAEDSARHRFLCCDYQGNKVAIISADGSVEWEFAAQTPQDCWLLPNGNVLFCYRNGAKEVSTDKQVVWEYKAPAEAECHSCQPLPNGRVLVAECGLSRLVEAGRDDYYSRPMSLQHILGQENRLFFRPHPLIFLFLQEGDSQELLNRFLKIVELSSAGALLRTIPVDGFPHAAIKLPDGHLLVTLGTAARVIELDQDLKIAWQLRENEVPGNPLRLPAGCQRLPNGNTIVCNYLPGGFLGKQPQAFEVTRDKRVVWEFTDHTRFKTVNQIYLLDLPGDAKNSGALR